MEYTDRYKAFCKRMSIYRKLMDYDQAKMAVRVGMTTPEYSNREAGRSMVSGIDLRKFSDSGADIDKDSTKDSMLKCIRDVNGITDQQVISDNLGISRFKYSKLRIIRNFRMQWFL